MLDTPHKQPAERHSDLEIAKAHRSALQGRLVRLNSERDRLTAAETAESTARADLDTLGRQEIEAVRRWAATASSDPAPKPDAARRHELTIAVAATEAQAAAARGAGGAVDVEIGEAQHELADLGASIEALAMAEMVDEFQTEWTAAQDAALALSGVIARCFGCLRALQDRAETLQTHGHTTAAVAIFRRLEVLTSGLAFSVEPSRAAVSAAAPAWTARLAELAR